VDVRNPGRGDSGEHRCGKSLWMVRRDDIRSNVSELSCDRAMDGRQPLVKCVPDDLAEGRGAPR